MTELTFDMDLSTAASYLGLNLSRREVEVIVFTSITVFCFVMALVSLACCCMMGPDERANACRYPCGKRLSCSRHSCCCCCCCRRTGASNSGPRGEPRDFDSLNELLFEVEDEETGIVHISIREDGKPNEDGVRSDREVVDVPVSVEAFFPDILSGNVLDEKKISLLAGSNIRVRPTESESRNIANQSRGDDHDDSPADEDDGDVDRTRSRLDEPLL